MAKSANQKLKLLYLMQILLENTDEEHGLRIVDIIEELSRYDIVAERKSLYSDFEALRTFGVDIISIKKNRTVYYYVGERDMELAELKLLVDVVQSSKFITEKKSRQLIGKLEHFASRHDAKKLNQQVFVHGRIKTMNESIYYNVDEIHSAIGADRRIRFQYFQWNVKKEMELRHGGRMYEISPWGLVWDDENYYLIGYDSQAEILKHYRVDKMLNIEVTQQAREGKETFQKTDMSVYTKKRFGMFDGRECSVTMICENHFAGVMIDRFGTDARMRPADEEHFQISVDVVFSNQFIGWIIGLGRGVQIISPESVVQTMKDKVRYLQEIYGDDKELK